MAVVFKNLMYHFHILTSKGKILPSQYVSTIRSVSAKSDPKSFVTN